MFMEWNKQWQEFVKNDDTYISVDLEVDDPRVSLDVYEGRATVNFTEYMEWHVEHNGDLWADTYIEDGYPSDTALDIWSKRINEELKKYYSSVPDVDVRADDGEPGITVELLIPPSVNGTVQEVMNRDMYPFIAAMINMCDPGTFNSPYLFS